MFKIWSEINKEARKELKPNLGLRDWDEMGYEEKRTMWEYFQKFDAIKSNKTNERVWQTAHNLNKNNKLRSYAKNFLFTMNVHNAIKDFKEIFLNHNKNQNVFLELISLFSHEIILERIEKKIRRNTEETDSDYNERQLTWQYEEFDNFAKQLNDLFEHFAINVYLTRSGFIPKQDKRIEAIYEPVLKVLSDEKWTVVNRELKDAFNKFQQKNPIGYSGCITHVIISIEAYLQIIVHKQTGKGTLGKLLDKAIKENLIPNDPVTQNIFNNLKSIFAQERKDKGDAHPKKEYANERNALTIMNLSMVFFQHCINQK